MHILISGGTGSENNVECVVRFIGEGSVVTIEDAAELQLQQPHCAA